MNFSSAYTIFPLSDSSLLVEFGQTIEESISDKVLAVFYLFKKLAIPGLLDIVPAYNSISISYDLIYFHSQRSENETVFDAVVRIVQRVLAEASVDNSYEKRNIKIPVCYAHSYAPDLPTVASTKKLTIDEVIEVHCSKLYRVFMIGFLPGFAYMGELDNKIEVPRKNTPVTVAAGSVGIAGKQTGIYPMKSPGGWQIIGRTPVQLFTPTASPPVLLQPGDQIEFFSISEDEFKDYQGRNS